MKITLLTPTPPDISAFGVRSISAYLRARGHETRVVFLPGSIGLLKEGGEFVYSYGEKILQRINELSSGSDLIGVSFFSSYLDRAVQLTRSVREALGVPVIWGGIHASCKPAECLEHADMVSIGEGEEAVAEVLERLSEGADLDGVEGIWFRRGGDIVKNGMRPLVHDLDSLPRFDFSGDGHYVYDRNTRDIVELTDEVLKNTLPLLPYFGGRLKRAFRTMTDRGCPHRCSYCNVSKLKSMYKDGGIPYFRSRSVRSVVEELVDVKERFPFVDVIQFFDDTFFARPYKQLEEFASLYGEKVSLPFYCQASPATLTEEKLKCLLDAGLVYVEMGVQTGSGRIKELYRRKESNEKILEVTGLLHKYRSNLLRPDYHVILDNPWETEAETLETVRLLYDIPKPFGLCISSLVFFPGTELYDRAVSEGLIRDEMKDIYRKPFFLPPKRNYPNFLVYLLTFQRFPRWALRFLMKDSTVRRLQGRNLAVLYRASYLLGECLRLVVKGVGSLMAGDIGRIAGYFKALLARDPVVAGRKS
jgi:radical SAM superfamily enzyme YgiQ (UPF0313 family)